MTYWLMKSEPGCYSIAQLKKDRRTCWDGVRNYQARNFMREMQVGDGVLFYHSNCSVPGVVGLAKVVKRAYPDHTAFDAKDPHFDPKSDPANPRWDMVDIGYVESFAGTISLPDLRAQAALSDMLILRKGNRLSVTPISDDEWQCVVLMAREMAA